MKSNLIITAVFTTQIFAAGCGGGDDNADLGGTMDALDAEISAQSDSLCDCYVEFGIPSREMCVAFLYQPLSPEERACASDAFGLDAAASGTYLDCLLTANQSYTTCIGQNLVCADETSLDACDAAFNADAGLCGDLPMVVNDALTACFPQ